MVNGLFPGNRPAPNTPLPPLSRPRPQVSEAEDIEADGPEPAPEGEDEDPLKDIVLSFWRDPDNKLCLTARSSMAEWLDSVITDGEKFFICFEGAAEPYVKLTDIPLEEIDTIVYDPNNHLKPVYYRRSWQELEFNGDGDRYEPKKEPKVLYYLDYRITTEELVEIKKRIKIPARKLAPVEQRIFHTYINPLWTEKGKRGISELYASREWFRVYKEFMEDRAAINAAATAVAYKRKIKAGPTEVSRFQNKFGGLPVGREAEENTTELKTLTRPAGAGIYDSNAAVDLEWMKTDTGAVNAEKDGRGLLSAAGAGVGMFIHYYGEGGDANLATAQAMELPMVKTFEDWQQWVEDNLRELCFYAIRVATDYENAEDQIDRIAGNFPPIISQDVVKYMTAWSQLVQNVASGNKVIRKEAIKGALTVMNVPNIDSIMNEVDAEEAALQVQRQVQQQAMLDGLRNGPAVPPNQDGNSSGTKPARNGSGNALPPDLKTVVAGKSAPERNGPKES
jgi:hypothetical protein